MGCGESIVKYILFFSNLVFALAGLASLGIGIAVQLKISAITEQTDTALQMTPITSMVAGGLVFLVAFFGCCGAIRESNCMLITYAVLMLSLMAVQLTFATMIFMRLDDVISGVLRFLDEAFKNKQSTFHELESLFKCCGTTGPSSYLSTTLPPSCCATTDSCTKIHAYLGCNTVVGNLLHTFGMSTGMVAIVMAAIALVAVVFAICLANHARRNNGRMRY